MVGAYASSALSDGSKSKCDIAPNPSELDANIRIKSQNSKPFRQESNEAQTLNRETQSLYQKEMGAEKFEENTDETQGIKEKQKTHQKVSTTASQWSSNFDQQLHNLSKPVAYLVDDKDIRDPSPQSSGKTSSNKSDWKRSSIPRLSIISEADSRTAWLQSGLLDVCSSVSQFVEDSNFPLDNCDPDNFDAKKEMYARSIRTVDREVCNHYDLKELSAIEGESSRAYIPERAHVRDSTKQADNGSMRPSTVELSVGYSSKTNPIKQFEIALNDKVLQRAINIDTGISSGVYNEYSEVSGGTIPEDLAVTNLPKQRDCSQNTKMRFPSKSGGWWIPHLKPLADFLDCTFEEQKYTFNDTELEFVKRVDYLLSCKFCYRGFNILMMSFMILDIALFVTVSSLFLADELSIEIELIHILFFDLVALFVLFALNSCASREVRVNGQYAVISYIRIYWHLMKTHVNVKFGQNYLFIDDWYGDDKYKFIKKKLYGPPEFELMTEVDLNDGSSYV